MIMTTIFKSNGKTYSANLVCILFVEGDVVLSYDLYVDEAQHKALLVKDSKVINTAHLESWQQDILVEDDKTEKEIAQADEVIDSLRKKWKI